MKQCVNCLRWKDESAFDWRYKALGVRDVTCRQCHTGPSNNFDQRHTCRESARVGEETKEYVHDYLSSHPCVVCGESDPRVLEFHYAGDKGWILSNLLGGGNALMAIQAEIANCTVLCVNCHKKIMNKQPDRLKTRK